MQVTHECRLTDLALARFCLVTMLSTIGKKFLDIMVESVVSNQGEAVINCSGILASRHTREIAQAIAERIGPN